MIFVPNRTGTKMKKQTKIAISIAAIATTGSLAFALPSLAHDRGSMGQGTSTSQQAAQMRNHAELPITVTGIPSDVTSAKDAGKGANYTVYRLADGESTLPATQPTEAGRTIGAHPERNSDGTITEPVISAGELIGELGFPAGEAGSTSYFALYPSDGGAAVLVTVVVDADGVATATSSADLSVAYSADVAAAAPEKGQGHRGDKGQGKGGHGQMGKKGSGHQKGSNPNA